MVRQLQKLENTILQKLPFSEYVQFFVETSAILFQNRKPSGKFKSCGILNVKSPTQSILK